MAMTPSPRRTASLVQELHAPTACSMTTSTLPGCRSPRRSTNVTLDDLATVPSSIAGAAADVTLYTFTSRRLPL
jgi:hypothetical protein